MFMWSIPIWANRNENCPAIHSTAHPEVYITPVDPVLGIIFVAAAAVLGLMLTLSRRGEARERSPPAKSFPFSEIEQDPNYPRARVIHTKIRGVSHQNPDGSYRQQVIRSSCHAGDALFLIREPGNPVDPNAVLIGRACQGTDGPIRGERLGYLSRELAQDFAPILDQGTVIMIAEILELTGDVSEDEGGNVGVNIRVEEYIWPVGPAA